jgi:hypothetical protein
VRGGGRRGPTRGCGGKLEDVVGCDWLRGTQHYEWGDMEEEEHMSEDKRGRSEKRYDTEASEGQMCGSRRWEGSGRCERRRREVEWKTYVSGSDSGKRRW